MTDKPNPYVQIHHSVASSSFAHKTGVSRPVYAPPRDSMLAAHPPLYHPDRWGFYSTKHDVQRDRNTLYRRVRKPRVSSSRSVSPGSSGGSRFGNATECLLRAWIGSVPGAAAAVEKGYGVGAHTLKEPEVLIAPDHLEAEADCRRMQESFEGLHIRRKRRRGGLARWSTGLRMSCGLSARRRRFDMEYP